MPVLRGHHLVCLHFFNGEGYDQEFVENLRDVLRMAEDGEIEICHGIDDVCRKCQHMKQDECRYSEHADEEIKEMDKKALELLRLSIGMKVRWYEIQERLPRIIHQWSEIYCSRCRWEPVCEKSDSYRQLKNSADDL